MGIAWVICFQLEMTWCASNLEATLAFLAWLNSTRFNREGALKIALLSLAWSNVLVAELWRHRYKTAMMPDDDLYTLQFWDKFPPIAFNCRMKLWPIGRGRMMGLTDKNRQKRSGKFASSFRSLHSRANHPLLLCRCKYLRCQFLQLDLSYMRKINKKATAYKEDAMRESRGIALQSCFPQLAELTCILYERRIILIQEHFIGF